MKMGPERYSPMGSNKRPYSATYWTKNKITKYKHTSMNLIYSSGLSAAANNGNHTYAMLCFFKTIDIIFWVYCTP